MTPVFIIVVSYVQDVVTQMDPKFLRNARFAQKWNNVEGGRAKDESDDEEEEEED